MCTQIKRNTCNVCHFTACKISDKFASNDEKTQSSHPANKINYHSNVNNFLTNSRKFLQYQIRT